MRQNEIDTKREKERQQTHTHTQRERQQTTDRRRDKDAERDRERQTETDRDKDKDRHSQRARFQQLHFLSSFFLPSFLPSFLFFLSLSLSLSSCPSFPSAAAVSLLSLSHSHWREYINRGRKRRRPLQSFIHPLKRVVITDGQSKKK